ncbi:hypothetical protein T03_1881 [Trichinella britovi]|uniref:Uncharacterized protein n=2 Tax=Trichinella TaxID=6333 RepID=A0A0V1C9T3_TRIBR|nr:hypothetical protein T05_285 [Trichinella murrelli]KRX66282.1 hypothetical protein T09_1360 [Trichinella sp. T9]KRY45832.1 hypothetical protein T03_1881 [Trichinella britovi]KRZ84002.1 hypothetical protein T08_7127 [Trichinella sp. T8]
MDNNGKSNSVQRHGRLQRHLAIVVDHSLAAGIAVMEPALEIFQRYISVANVNNFTGESSSTVGPFNADIDRLFRFGQATDHCPSSDASYGSLLALIVVDVNRFCWVDRVNNALGNVVERQREKLLS